MEKTDVKEITSAEGQPSSEPVVPAVEDKYADLPEEVKNILVEKDSKISKLAQDNEQKETMIQRQKQQIGTVKKVQQQTAEANAELQKAINLFREVQNDPDVSKEDYANAKSYLDSKQAQVNALGTQTAQGLVLAIHPDFEQLLVKGIPEVLRSEGYDELSVQKMQTNWRLDPDTAIAYADKARYYLETEELRSKLANQIGQGNNVLDKITNAQSLSVPSGGMASMASSVKPIEEMSSEEISAEYAKLAKEGKVTPK